MPTKPSKKLETFLNPHPQRDYIIEIETAEFTCLCPKTGQPDFATIRLEYVPDALCVELKSLKLYYWSFRDEGAFHEDVTNKIFDRLVQLLSPRYLKLTALFNVRGGLYTTVEVDHLKDGWTPPPPPPDYLPREQQQLPGNDDAAVDSSSDGEQTPDDGRFRMLRRSSKVSKQLRDEMQTEAPPTPAPPPAKKPIFIGIDMGTTGCRVLAIDEEKNILGHAESPLPASMVNGDQITQDANQWWKACLGALANLCNQIDTDRVEGICVDGTSGTLLLCDKEGSPTIPAMMYNDSRAVEQVDAIEQHASTEAAVHNASSSLAKLLWLQTKGLDKKADYIMHQADWISGMLSGVWGHSDYNNCLKLGYDAGQAEWPGWMTTLGVNTDILPTVHEPGDALGNIKPELAKQLNLPTDTAIIAGTTDGVAAFVAAGAKKAGHGVTSLGSTLIIKLLSGSPIFSPQHGVYSHRLGNYWLAGGASNSGGNVLLQYFNVKQMKEMEPMLDPSTPTGLHYYPLIKPGERFPVNDPELEPKMEPLPGDSVIFFQGLLEGIAEIEARGYKVLADLGGPTCKEVRTTGGGSHNEPWTRIRAAALGVTIRKPRSDQAAFGAALIAAGVVQKAFQ